MSTIASLSAERDKAKSDLVSSPAWVAWKSAITALLSPHEMPVFSVIDPTPEEVLHGFDEWDATDPIVNEYKRVQQLQTEKRRADELKQRVEESEEWRSLIQLNRQLKAQLAEEVKQLRQSLLVVDKADKTTVKLSPQAPNEGASPNPAQLPFEPQSQPAEPPAVSQPANGRSEHSPVNHLPPAASRPTTVTSSSSPVKRDESSKLMVPSWCSGVVSDLYQPVPEYGLGLVDEEVYHQMCGSVRSQVQRVWSSRDNAHSLLAALLRAVEFQVDTNIEPPSHARVDELRDSMLKTASLWSAEELAARVPGYESKEMSTEQFLKSADGDTALLYLYRALHRTAPRIYVIVGNRATHPPLSLLIVDGKDSPKLNTRCIVLFRNMSTEPLPHVEVIGWKRGSRGPSPLKTVLDFSETIIQSLEAWYVQHQTPPSATTRKRARVERTPAGDNCGADE